MLVGLGSLSDSYECYGPVEQREQSAKVGKCNCGSSKFPGG